MSGFEILGVIGTAATLVDLSAKIWKHLDTFVQRSREADAVAKDLQAKVYQLRTCSETVQRAGRSRERQPRVGQQGIDEIRVWTAISETLRQCERDFQEFEEALEGLVRGCEEPRWLNRALLQRRIERGEPKIARLERKIDIHLTTLNISILSVHFIVHMTHHAEITSMFASGHLEIMQRLDQSLQSGRDQLRRSTDQPLPASGEQEVLNRPSASDVNSAIDVGDSEVQNEEISTLQIAVNAGNTVRAISVYAPSAESVRHASSDTADRHGVFSDNTENLGPSPGSRYMSISSSRISVASGTSGLWGSAISVGDDDPLKDPTPYFDDITPREVLKELIRRLREQVERNRSEGRYHQAEINQREAISHLEELYIGYGEPFNNLDEMRGTLAEILCEQGNEAAAERLIVADLEGRSRAGRTSMVTAPTMVNAGVTPARARQHYILGRIKRGQCRRDDPDNRLYLEFAEREAKRAFKCSFETRQTQHTTFTDSVALLIQIYEDGGKPVHAATYRELYLPQSEDPRSPPSPHPSTLSLAISRSPTVQSRGSTGTGLTNNSGSMPSDLITAIRDEREDCISDLLQGANLEKRSNAVKYAVDRGNERAIHRLHQAGVNLDQALLHAVEKGKAGMTNLLLDLDANKEVTEESSGKTPLILAAGTIHAAVVRILLDRKVNVDACDREGWSAIHYAALKGSAEVMHALLDPQYQVNKNAAICPGGKTALHICAERDRDAIAAVLLEHGADTEITTSAHRTPLYIAVERHKTQFVDVLVDVLVRKGVTIEAGSLPNTSQEVENLLARVKQPAPAPTRRDSDVSTSSRQKTVSRFIGKLSGGGLRRSSTTSSQSRSNP